jgi:hypothetical protein
MTFDEFLLGRVRAMWRVVDPAPDGLAERALFAVELEHLDAEVLRMRQEPALAARAGDPLRSVTFSTDELSMLLALPTLGDDQGRVDGWIVPGGGLRVELRLATGRRNTVADSRGRFAFDAVPQGPAQIVLHPTDGAAVALARPVVTPTLSL